MDKLKKGRRPYRAQLTKTVKDIEAELAKDPVNRNTVHVKLDILNQVHASLKEWDEKVEVQLINDDATPDEVDGEYNDMMKYEEDYLTARRSAESSLEPPQQRPQSPTGSVGTYSTAMAPARTFKLPKIELKKFSGELKDWLGFWSQFSKIDEDAELHNSDKFQYLVQAMAVGSRAQELVNSYPQTGDNYPKVIKALKDRFGKDELLVEVYVRELLQLVIHNVNQSKDNLDLSKMYDQLESHLRALESLGVSSDKYDAMLYPMVESCLPVAILRAWQRSSLINKRNPAGSKLQILMDFLRTEVEGEQRIDLARQAFGMKLEDFKQKDKFKKNRRQSEEDTPTALSLHNSSSEKSGCGFCGKKHESQDCFTAQSITLDERRRKLQENNRCFICLRAGHRSSTYLTKSKAEDKPPENSGKDGGGEQVSSSLSNQTSCPNVLMPTLIVLAGEKKQKRIRAAIDTCSQRSYILPQLAEELGMKPTGKVTFTHSLFGGKFTNDVDHTMYKVHLQNATGKYRCNFDVFDEAVICAPVGKPNNPQLTRDLKALNIKLSDQGHDNLEIGILIGADVCGKLLTGGIHQLGGGLTALETRLGWIVTGKVQVTEKANYTVTSMINMQTTVKELWDLESIGITDPSEKLSKQEMDEQAREHFRSTVTRTENGRYQVALPWIDGHPTISSNSSTAEKRLRNAATKLIAQNKFEDYNKIFEEWINLGIIEEVHEEEQENQCHYLCHRPVFKPDSLTTKVRPVFDASCPAAVLSGMRAESGFLQTKAAGWTQARASLNDCLAKGPNLLEQIPELLLRFRAKSVGATADIRKAFLMIEITARDRDFLRFFWWEDPTMRKKKILRHRRVVFGINCSPFLLLAVIETHLNGVPVQHQDTAKKLWNSLYVDNVVASFNSEDEYHKFKKESIAIMSDAQFDLRLWESNSDQPQELGVTGVLGIKWDRASDTLFCDVNPELFEIKIVTRRSMLSCVAKIFDPLGVLSPVTLVPKILVQETWTASIGWDQEVETGIAKQFGTWLQETKFIPQIRVPRHACAGNKDVDKWSIHIFADASTLGFGCCAFLRCEDEENVKLELLISRSRVAPKKKTTINRLELVACELAVRLAHTVQTAMEFQDLPCVYWTDSSTALAWIRRNDQWGTFVGNRVSKILSLTQADDWRHVPGAKNPADLPSRGCDARFLLQSKWWEGPTWLTAEPSEWPANHYAINENDVLVERKKTVVAMAAVTDTVNWYSSSKCRISKWNGLVRVMAYVMRIARREKHLSQQLSVEEFNRAEKKLFLIIQKEAFTDDQKFSLQVKRDEEGILRVETKIAMRDDLENFKFPILLPANHYLVEMYIRSAHLEYCHAGTQFLVAKFREQVWILKGRKAVDKVVTRCVRCRRYNSKHPDPPAAPLPENRVRDADPFEITGIDAAGPLHLRDKSKVWIMLFTCAVTRAVHLQLVSGLSTEVFLLSLRRFIARCGRPSVVYTDNGTNFTGAAKLLQKLDWQKIEKETSTNRIKWIFNPPSAPWYGGWWERLVRTVKDLLRRMLGTGILDYEELYTVLCDVESVVNGRPLSYVFENDTMIPLTPFMLIRGIRQAGVLDMDKLDTQGPQKRFKFRQRLMEDLRQRFRKEYLGLLVQRNKKTNSIQLKVGDVALIGCDNKKRLAWPIGRITEIINGRDGIPRVAKVKTATGMLTRPFQRIYPLEVSSEEAQQMVKADESGNQTGESAELGYRTKYGRLVRKPSL